jgi:hypothetical protein
VRDTCIIVAVDEPPEEGLEQPLRLEKLANEVSSSGSSGIDGIMQHRQQPTNCKCRAASDGPQSALAAGVPCATHNNPGLTHTLIICFCR